MANTIKRNTIFIECMALTDSEAFGAGECVGNYRKYDMWIAKDSNGKKWRNLTANLRNENFYKFINQYSMSDIIYYLMDKNADYQTVMTDMLIEAIETTFEETRVCCIDDIYNYISENLIQQLNNKAVRRINTQLPILLQESEETNYEQMVI